MRRPTVIKHSNKPAVQIAPTHKISERKTCLHGLQTVTDVSLKRFSLDDFHVIPVTAAGSASVSVSDPLSD